MKIAAFYQKHTESGWTGGAAWSLAGGIPAVLSRLGHEVTDIEEGQPPPQDILEQQDVLFVSGPEYAWRRIRSQVPNWDAIKKPKIGWLHETVEREDYKLNPYCIAINGRLPLHEIKKFTPNLFTMASQDQIHDLRFMPCGVDTEMFHPNGQDKIRQVLFIGHLYPRRSEFLSRYPDVTKIWTHFNIDTTPAYAAATSAAGIVLNLPSYSETLIARVYEVMACKTALITPIMGSGGEGNYKLFEHGKHLMYYSGDPMPAINTLLNDAACRDQIAQQGYDEVIAKHKLEFRLNKMFEASC